MAHWKITISGKGIRRDGVEKLAESLKAKYLGEDVHINVTDNTPPESRPDRFEAAKSLIEDAKSAMEELKDELQEWYDNLPEGFQNGEKGEALQAAIDSLNDVGTNLDNACDIDVEFPGMFS